MTDGKIHNNDDDEATYEYTCAQASISEAFKKGNIEIRMVDSKGTSIYHPAYLVYSSSGHIIVVVHTDRSEEI